MFTPTEELRIQAIETAINNLAKAVNNLATKRELNNLIALYTEQVQELQDLVLTNTAGGLAAHLADTFAHSGLYWYYNKSDFVSTRNGIQDADHPLLLNHSGFVDYTFVSGVL